MAKKMISPSTRRDMLIRSAGVVTLFGMGSSPFSRALAATTATPALTPVETEGPYWVDELLNRSDITVDPSDNSIQEGLPLVLTVNVSQLNNGTITPLPNAQVDIWHCNAIGVYSDEAAYNPGGGTGTVVTTGKKFLRGYQITDSHGVSRFRSIYPGWYSGRTAHIHCRVRLFTGITTTTNFVTQFFFDDAITDQVYLTAPYNVRTSARDTVNSTDSVYTPSDCVTGVEVGTEGMLKLNANTSRAVASFNIVLDVATSNAATSSCGSGGGGGTGPGGPGGPGGPPPGGPGGTPPPAL